MGIMSSIEQKILRLYSKNILLRVSIRHIMKLIKSNSYSRTHEAINKLVARNILAKENIGNTMLVRINNSRETVLWLSFLEELNIKYTRAYEKIVSIEEISDYLVMIVGSYAKGTYSKSSDMDLVIIVPDHENVTSIHKLITNKTLLWKPSLHIHVLKKKDFSEMLCDSQNNFGKETARNKIILRNARIYYELVLGAMNNGYTG
jgi:predicted nucleotidyltransferase